jgi:hypothetical protein
MKAGLMKFTNLWGGTMTVKRGSGMWRGIYGVGLALCGLIVGIFIIMFAAMTHGGRPLQGSELTLLMIVLAIGLALYVTLFVGWFIFRLIDR